MDTGPAADIAKTAYNTLFNKLGRIQGFRPPPLEMSRFLYYYIYTEFHNQKFKQIGPGVQEL